MFKLIARKRLLINQILSRQQVFDCTLLHWGLPCVWMLLNRKNNFFFRKKSWLVRRVWWGLKTWTEPYWIWLQAKPRPSMLWSSWWQFHKNFFLHHWRATILCMTLSVRTRRITKFSITTFSVMTLSATTQSIMMLSKTSQLFCLIAELSLTFLFCSVTSFLQVMLSVIMISVIILRVVAPLVKQQTNKLEPFSCQISWVGYKGCIEKTIKEFLAIVILVGRGIIMVIVAF